MFPKFYLGFSYSTSHISRLQYLYCSYCLHIVIYQYLKMSFQNFHVCVCYCFFQVVIVQMNGVDQPSQSIHVFHIGKMRIKLCKGKTTVAKEYYSTSMQVFIILPFSPNLTAEFFSAHLRFR